MKVMPFRGFVLKSISLSTHRHILITFTQKGGKRQGVFRVGKKQPRAYLTPLTLLHFQLRGKEQAALPTLVEPNLERHYFDFAADYLGLTLLSHWANLVDACQPDAQEDERVFRLLDHCLSNLDAKQKALLPAQNLYFEMWLLHFCGVLPRSRTAAPSQPNQQNETVGRDVEQLFREIDPIIIKAVFQQKIEDFAAISLQCGALARGTQLLDQIWMHFLGRDLKTHLRLQDRFKERGLL